MDLKQHFAKVKAALCGLVVLGLLVPMLLAILPSPVSALEAQLYRDLQNSRCAEQGQPMQDEQPSCEHCVLCAASSFPYDRAEVDRRVNFGPVARAAKVSFIFAALSRAELAAVNTPDPGRGPPA